MEESQLSDSWWLLFSGTLIINLITIVSAVEQKDAAVIMAIAFVFRSVGSTLGIKSGFYRLSGCTSEIEQRTAKLDYMKQLTPAVQKIVMRGYMKAIDGVFLSTVGLTVAGAIARLSMRHQAFHRNPSRP